MFAIVCSYELFMKVLAWELFTFSHAVVLEQNLTTQGSCFHSCKNLDSCAVVLEASK